VSKQTTRAVLSVAVVLGAFIAVMYTTVSEGAQHYKHVDEVMVDPDAWYGKQMQLHGFVVEGSIEQRPNTLDYRFRLMTGDHSVMATYSGVVPDTFKGGTEVVLTGRLGPDGFATDPYGVTAKGPSRYEVAGPSGPSVR
jgi:cytochrome c-type biogenesis protein CcmE